MSEVNERTQRTSLLRGPVEDIPGLTTYLATNFLPIAGGTMAGELFIASGGGLYLYDPSTEADVQLSVDDGELLVGNTTVLDNSSTLNASNLGFGTVSDARLSANVARLNAASNAFTGPLTSGGSFTAASGNNGFAGGGIAIGFSGVSAGFIAGGQLNVYESGVSKESIVASQGINLASDRGIFFSSTTGSSGSKDVSILRNATGPTLETRAAGGLKVCNADGSAVGPVEASKLTLNAGTKAAVAIQLGTGGPGYGIYSSNVGSTPGFGFAIGGTSFIYTSDVSQGFNIHSGFAYGWGSGAADTAMDTRFTRNSAGVVDLGTTSDNANGSLNLANLTASGGITFGARTKSALLATSATATAGCWRITDSTPAQRLAYPDGTNWRYFSDDTVVT